MKCMVVKRTVFAIFAGAVVALLNLLMRGCVGQEGMKDMGSIAFISQRYDTNGDGRIGAEDDFHLYVMDADGRNQKRVSHIPVRPGLDWAPDGQRIVASVKTGETWKVCIFDTREGGLQCLTQGEYHELDPTWSPDGREIAFVSNRGGDGFQIFVMGADGTQLRQISHVKGNPRHPTWSPDGKRIAFAAWSEEGFLSLFVIDKKGTIVDEIVSPAGGGQLSWPEFSPDGSYLVCNELIEEHGPDIVLFSTSGEHKRTYVTSGDFPTWSPDGKRIGFSAIAGSEELFPSSEICVVNVDGTGFHRLTRNEFVDGSPSWQPGS